MPKIALKPLLIVIGIAFLLQHGDARPSQLDSTCTCPPEQVVPVTGRVLDATDGRPITGATVLYRGMGDTGDQNGGIRNPPSLHGEVKTGPDGSYRFPQLPIGSYYVRVVAHGYLGGRRMLVEHSAWQDPSYFPDPIFRLPPDTLRLTVMSEEARIEFSFPRSDNKVPVYNGRNYGASAFSSDGNSFVLITRDYRGNKDACILWRIALTSGDLTKVNAHLPAKFCGTAPKISLDGDSVLAYLTNSGAFPAKPEAFRIHGNDVDPVPIADLPSELKASWGVDAASPQPEADDDSVLSSETTVDGKFTIVLRDRRDGCESLMEILEDNDWKSTINACDSPTYLFDRYRDRVYDFVSDSGGDRPGPFEYRYPQFAESDLITRSYRTFTLPQFSYDQLMAFHPMPDGGTRVAYSAKGECDEPSTDSPQSQSDPVIGPERPNICFITIPPVKANSSAASLVGHPR